VFKLLIVDDNVPNLQLLGNILKGQYSLTFATSGQEALKILENARPDLILLDIMMPGIDGYEVCRRLKNNEMTKGIPIVFLSAKNDWDSVVKGMKVGALDYLIKPFTPEMVIQRIKNILSHSNTSLDKSAVRKNEARSPVFHEIRRANDDICFQFYKRSQAETVKNIEESLNPLVEVIPNLLKYTKDLEDLLFSLESGKRKDLKSDIERIQNERLDPEITATVHTLHDNLQDIQFKLIDCININSPDIKEYSDNNYLSLKSFLDDIKKEIPPEIGIQWETSKEILLPDRQEVLRQILLSLIDNALDALDKTLKEGSCTISISLNNNILDISILDSGRGINEELALKMEHDGFSTKSMKRGSGLAASRFLVNEYFQGEIKINPGSSGHVSILIPLK